MKNFLFILVFILAVPSMADSLSDLLSNRDISVLAGPNTATSDTLIPRENSSEYQTVIYKNEPVYGLKKLDYYVQVARDQYGVATRVSEFHVDPNPISDKMEETFTTNAVDKRGNVEARTTCGGKTSYWGKSYASSTEQKLECLTTTPKFCSDLKAAMKDQGRETSFAQGSADLKNCSDSLKKYFANSAIATAMSDAQYKTTASREKNALELFQSYVNSTESFGKVTVDNKPTLARQAKSNYFTSNDVKSFQYNDGTDAIQGALKYASLMSSALDNCALLDKVNPHSRGGGSGSGANGFH